jgi:hypothetical protein
MRKRKKHDGKNKNFRKLGAIIRRAKILAREYRKLTGKPLGITGEIGEFEAARLLHLSLCVARQHGYDATRRKKGIAERIQIKTRVVPPGPVSGQRLGLIEPSKPWDRVVMVLLDEDYEARAVHEASRSDIKKELKRLGPKAKRRGFPVKNFQAIARQVFPRER